MKLKYVISKTNRLILNARKLPQNEYQNLDKFMVFPNDCGIQACMYNTGVVIYIESPNYSELKNTGFPVLAHMLDELYNEFDVEYVDFDETYSDETEYKQYNW